MSVKLRLKDMVKIWIKYVELRNCFVPERRFKGVCPAQEGVLMQGTIKLG